MLRFIMPTLLTVLAVCSLVAPAWPFGPGSMVYVHRAKANMRSGPGAGHAVVGVLERNSSLVCQGARDGWANVATKNGATGWVRSDMLSDTAIHILKNERTLTVYRNGTEELSIPVRPGAKGLGSGRYFGTPVGRKLSLSWPNRQDLRTYLETGRIPHAAYQSAVLGGPEALGGAGLAICPGPEGDANCGVVIAPGDFKRLVKAVPTGARVGIYANGDAEKEINDPDFLAQRINEGAARQLANPAAGLARDSRVPRLAYPGGDIQPDLATSADIVIRSVRHAGLDLQALVHEDMLLHPARYSGLDMGNADFGAHRQVPVLHVYLKHHALPLPADVREAPYSFEPGDIVFFDSNAGASLPDRVGVVGERYDQAGVPLVVTVWGMGQSTREMDLLGRETPRVVGHFRMTHLFDYQ